MGYSALAVGNHDFDYGPLDPREPAAQWLPRHVHGAPHQLPQALERRLAVQLEAAVALGLDDHDAVARDALIAQRQQPLLARFGQRRGAHVEAQVHGVGNLIDVLPAGPLSAHCAQLDLVERD